MTGSDFNGIGAGICALIATLMCLAPFGIWKLIEIVIWIFNHVHIRLS